MWARLTRCRRSEERGSTTPLIAVGTAAAVITAAIAVAGFLHVRITTTPSSPRTGTPTTVPIGPPTTTARPTHKVATVVESTTGPSVPAGQPTQVVSSQSPMNQSSSGSDQVSPGTLSAPATQPTTVTTAVSRGTVHISGNNNTIVVHKSTYQSATSGNASCTDSTNCGSVTSGNAGNNSDSSTNILISGG